MGYASGGRSIYKGLLVLMDRQKKIYADLRQSFKAKISSMNHINRIVFTLMILMSLPVCGAMNAQDRTDLSIQNIPKTLRSGTPAVIRNHDSRITLEKQNLYTIDVRKEITVFKEKGSHFLTFVAAYKSSSEKLYDIDVRFYNAEGALIKKVKKKEIEDRLALSNFEFAGDSRIKTYNYETLTYPVTISISYSKQSENTMHLPAWFPIENYNVAVQSSTYQLHNETDISLDWMPLNLSKYPSITSSSDQYMMKDQKSIRKESYSPSYYEVFPMVLTRSEQYAYEGHLGGHDSWQEWGAWMYHSFLQDKANLNAAEIRKEMDRHIDEGLPKRELIRALYDYVQENTRYIFISLEDGGFTPLSAQKVHDVKYGDCKALTFYMKSLLELYKIPSNYVVVHASGDQPIDMFVSYPSTRPGNHVILNVPLERDTIWLDCTSHDNPFNYLGSFSDDRIGVEVHPDGGRLIRTPRYDLDDNVEHQSVELEIHENGDINVTLMRNSYGLFYERGMQLNRSSKEDLEAYIKTDLLDGFDRVSIGEYSLTLDEKSVRFDEHYSFSASAYGELAGDYLILPIRFLTLPVPRLKKDKRRVNPIVFYRDKMYHRETIYKDPDEYRWNSIDDVYLESKYGQYTCSAVELEDGRWKISRSFKLYKGQYDALEYNNIKRFFDSIRKQERRQISLTKKS